MKGLRIWGAVLMCCATLQIGAQPPQQDPFRFHVPAESEAYTPAPDSILTKYPKFDDFLRTRLKFSVPVISGEQLKKRLESGERFLLLDVRDIDSYNTGHIPGAKRVGYHDFSVEKVWMYKRTEPVVVYCTIGERSEQVGEYLREMGFTNVVNLYGSIVEWANVDGPLQDDKGNPSRKIMVKNEFQLKKELLKNRKIKMIHAD